MKKAVHFGAGSIGRGFIADLLHDTGYEVTFLDVNDDLINQINKTNSYNLYLINDGYKKKVINNVKAISSIKEEAAAINAIVEANIITTSVWADNLPRIAPTLLKGLKARYENNCPRINVLACENAISNTDILKNAMLKLDNQFTLEMMNKVAAFPNTAVDRMVLASSRDGENTIDIGKDHELAIEKDKLVDINSEPIKGAIYTDNLDKYIERKLYVINCGHAWAGFIGHIKGFTTMQETFNYPEQEAPVREVMRESAQLVAHKYGFTMEEMEDYIDFALGRFETPGVIDYISRVSRSPIRKLQPNERLVGPCMQCEELGFKNERLVEGIASVFLYDEKNDEQSVQLLKYIDDNGIEKSITHYTAIESNLPIFSKILQSYNDLKNRQIKPICN